MKFNEYFKPMLLRERAKPFDNKDYLYELKFDGYRATIHVSPKSIKIFSRNGIDLTDVFPELKSIQSLVDKNTIFDGEIVAFENDKPSFSNLQKRARIKSKRKIQEISRLSPVVFAVFDCLYYNKDLTKKTLIERKNILNKFQDNENFLKTTYTIGKGKSLFQKVKKLNLEGIVAKKLDSFYYPDTRSKDWIKIKNYKTGIFYIGGYINTSVKRSLVLGEYRDNKFYFVGKVSVDKRVVLNSKKITKNPFTNFNDKNVTYLSPKEKCEVVFIERTPNNNLREPVFKRMINDE